MAYKKEKFKDLVHYIAASREDSRRLGSVKLNKVLWYSDTLAYKYFGESITGSGYLKRQLGPVPKRILACLEELGHEGRVIRVSETMPTAQQRHEFVPLSEPNIDEFSAREISLVDKVIAWVCDNHTAQSISDHSHNEIWEMAEIGEDMPVSTVLVSNLGEVDENDMKWAAELAT